LWVAECQWRSRSKLDFFQRYLLAIVYQQLNGHEWNRNQKWLSHESVFDWEGIVCFGPTSEVREIHLMNNSLSGLLPNHELGILTNLQKVRMENNPYLSGSISSEITALKSLQIVSFSNTSLSGAIPNNFSNSLAELNMSFTSLEGSLPTELGHLTLLRKLDLKKNQLSGTIPTEFRNLEHLEYIDLSWNQLTGSIPNDWKVPFLNTLLINHNHNLSGQIPVPPSPLIIQVNFADTSLSGRVPSEYCELNFLDAVIIDCANGTKLKYCACCWCINAI
jgi:Leucine-rich repeat (LRR) protein